MANKIIQMSRGLTDNRFRKTIRQASPTRKGAQVILPDGQVIDIPNDVQIAEYVTEYARDNGIMIDRGQDMNILPGTQPKDLFEMYEKNYYLKGLGSKFKGNIHNTETGKIEAVELQYQRNVDEAKALHAKGELTDAKLNEKLEELKQQRINDLEDARSDQWDTFVVSFEDGYPDDKRQQVRDIVVEELRSTSLHMVTTTMAKNHVAEDGKRLMLVTNEHDNTKNMHYHFAVSRFAFDPVKNEVSASLDLSKAGIFGRQTQLINDRLKAAGLEALVHSRDFSEAYESKAQKNEQAKTTVKELVKEVGGDIHITEPKVLTPEIETMQRAAELLTKEMTERQTRIDADMKAQREAAAKMAGIQQGISATAQLEELKLKVQEQEKALAALSEAHNQVKQEKDQVVEQHQDLTEKHTSTVAELEEKTSILNEVDEAVVNYLETEEYEALEGAYERVDAIGEKMATAVKELAKTTEELTQATTLVDELSEQKDKLAKDLKAEQELSAQKDAAIEKMQADLEKLQADMAEMQKTLAAKTEAVEKAEKFESALKNLVVDATGDNSYKSMAAEEVAQKFAIRYTESVTETKRVLNERDVIKGRVESLEQQLEGLKNDLQTERESKQALRVDIAALNQDKAELREELAKVEKQNTRFRTAITEYEAELNAARSNTATDAREAGRTEVAKNEEANAAKKQAEKGQTLGDDEGLTNS